jgi:hypothetical protein
MQEKYVFLIQTQCSSLISGAITCFVSAAVCPATRDISFILLAVLLYILSIKVCEIHAHFFNKHSFSLTLNDHKCMLRQYADHHVVKDSDVNNVRARISRAPNFWSAFSKKVCTVFERNMVKFTFEEHIQDNDNLLYLAV